MLEHAYFMCIGHMMRDLDGGHFSGTTFIVAVNRIIYCTELVPGRKNMFTAWNFMLSVNVDIEW